MKYAREDKKWDDWEVIFDHFVPRENDNRERNLHPANVILSTAERKCIDKVTSLREYIKAGTGSENFDPLIELEITIAQIGFAWGFVLGQIFDFPDPEGKKAINAIRGKIFRSGILPYITLDRTGPSRSKKLKTRQKTDLQSVFRKTG